MAQDDPAPHFLPIGSFVGNDGKSVEVAIYIQTLVRLVDVSTGRPLPSGVTHGIKVLDTIKYPEDIQKGWAHYLKSERTDWLLHNKQNGEKARKNHLENLWDATNSKPEKRVARYQEVLDNPAQGGTSWSSKSSRGGPTVEESVMKSSSTKAVHTMKHVFGQNGIDNSWPSESFGNTPIPETFPNTSIQKLHHFDVDAWKQYDTDAFTVIVDFLTGRFFASRKQEGDRCTSIDALESAFWVYGYRINPSDATKASDDIKHHPYKDSVLHGTSWFKSQPCLLVEEVEMPYNWVKKLLDGENLADLKFTKGMVDARGRRSMTASLLDSRSSLGRSEPIKVEDKGKDEDLSPPPTPPDWISDIVPEDDFMDSTARKRRPHYYPWANSHQQQMGRDEDD
ncbi:hypothetical protein VTL71DRAFT_14466 [Oculimacula yallundae]|uniref:Uncharacterized protein n=1 Tax=Oculimacula yallundae TaxID=86028 RepID=A0ABR4CII6_9HELO